MVFVCFLWSSFVLCLLVLGSAFAWVKQGVPSLYEMWWSEPGRRLHIAAIVLSLLLGPMTAAVITARFVGRAVLRRFPTIQDPSTLELDGSPPTASIVTWFAGLWGGVAAALAILVAMSIGFWTLRNARIAGDVWRELSAPADRYRVIVIFLGIIWALLASLPVTVVLWSRVTTSWLHLSDDDIDKLLGGFPGGRRGKPLL